MHGIAGGTLDLVAGSRHGSPICYGSSAGAGAQPCFTQQVAKRRF